jgi:hypothetical protein
VSLVRTIDFGDLESGIWGGAWVSGADAAVVHVGTPAGLAPAGAAGALDGDQPSSSWSLSAPGVKLAVEPVEGVPAAATGDRGYAQLCRVHGSAGVEIDCVGVRAVHELPDGGYGSVRALSGWFGPHDGFAVTAVRPRKAKGHGGDRLTGVVFESGSSMVASEPRLSSTYAPNGRPIRAGLELWFTHEEGEDTREFSRRAAGQAVGAALDVPGGDGELRAGLFRWHARGLEGAGVYRLVHRR